MDVKIPKKSLWVRYRKIFAAICLVAGVLVYLIYLVAGPSRLRYNRRDLQIAEVRREAFLEYVEVEGVAGPRLTVKLNGSEDGVVERIVAEEGRMLQAGDTILVLSNPELIRSLEDERDNLEKQQISYEEKLLQMQRKTSELRRTHLKTRYELERLSKQYQLDREEYEIGIRSKAQLDVATDEYLFNQENARLLLEELRHDSLSNNIQADLMRNDLTREEKRYLRGRQRIDNLVVRAPVAGQLSYIVVTTGERVGAGFSLGELKVIDKLKLTARINEYYIDRVVIGLPASVTYQGEKYPLRISKINPEIKDRQFEVDLVFEDKAPDNVNIGKSYSIQIELDQPQEALVVDKGNFYQATGGRWVFRLLPSGDRARRVQLSIGRQNPDQYEVLEGLSEGDRVIVTGYDYFGQAEELILK